MLRRLIWCTLLAAASMLAQQFHIDHVTVAGKNVEAMTKALSSVAGITAQYGGPHSNHATEMALASFPDGSYLELIAIQAKADPAALAAHYWHKFMEADAGPCAWAIRPPDLNGEVERLRKARVDVTDPRKSGRQRPDGVQLDWETAQVGPTNGGFFPFLIHDFTPRENRAFPTGKPTTTEWTGVAKVVIGVNDLDAAIAQYRQAYWIDPPQRQEDTEFGAKLAWFRGTPVVLAAPLSSQSWLGQRIQRFGEAPCAFILGSRKSSVLAGPKSKWFGRSVFWADSEKLGWRLGFQPK
jgi:Glyoxalase-like domain